MIPNILKQRRVWVAILSATSILLKYIGIEFQTDEQTILLGSFLPDIINGVLAGWSYLKPKKKKELDK